MTDDEKAVKAEASKAALLAAYRRLKPREQRAFFVAFKRSAGGEPFEDCFVECLVQCGVPRAAAIDKVRHVCNSAEDPDWAAALLN